MKKLYDIEYVAGMEQRIRDLEQELHVWEMNGVMLDVDIRLCLYCREMDHLREAMDEDERREAERVDELMAEAGL